MSEKLIESSAFDVLADVFETLRFRGSIFLESDLAAPWGMDLKKLAVPRFHVIFAGCCFVGVDGREQIQAQEMDIVMLPGGHSHWIADLPDSDRVASDRASEMCELGSPLFQNGEITHRLMCGIVHYDHHAAHPLLTSMPELLHFRQIGSTAPVWATVMSIEAELRQHGSQRSPVVDRLTEVLVLQLLRQAVEDSTQSNGFFAALCDRRVSQALALMHADPAFEWTLDLLGERVGMSRATLVRHFHSAVGEAPMTYLTNWRLMKARRLLEDTTLTLAQIAESVGFGSAKTLSRSFQRRYQRTPSQVRQKV